MLKQIKKTIEGEKKRASDPVTRPYSFDLSEMRSKKILMPIAVSF
jgi:hypothetical protein